MHAFECVLAETFDHCLLKYGALGALKRSILLASLSL